MRLLDVYYSGWGEDWRLAQLANDGRQLLFEYASEALAQGLELSPVHLKLRAQAYGGFEPQQFNLPGLIADALPDGWGLLLMDRLFRLQKLPHPSPLDRLAFIGERAMGALRFVPAANENDEVSAPDWNLLTLAHYSMQMLKGEAHSVLRELAVTGGSPQGARPKALIQYEPSTGELSTHSDAPGAPWLVKFPAQGEHPEVCAIEALYLSLAVACGIETPTCQLFELTPKISAIAVARFDRQAGMRVPIHSLAGLLHGDFRQPGSVDYLALLRATRLLARDEREVQKAFARAVFNALLHNRDDHPKNIAFRLSQDRRWRLAPAFDLTFSNGPGGQHHMDFVGVAHDLRAHGD
jgi:serine/threonine-protein kinase HipA